MILKNIHETSRVWVYGFSNKLNESDLMLVTQKLQQFVESWQYHGSNVDGDFLIFENRFAFLYTNDSISGCSIDSSVAVFKSLKDEHNLDALDHNIIFFRDESEIKTASRYEFQQLVNSGAIQPTTRVFNLNIQTAADLRNGLFEADFNNSWHHKAFPAAKAV